MVMKVRCSGLGSVFDTNCFGIGEDGRIQDLPKVQGFASLPAMAALDFDNGIVSRRRNPGVNPDVAFPGLGWMLLV